MSSGTHYIGSKISLISKAEIRYEGILYQVDTKEATVTLAKVRSFGTENRPAPKQIPPRNETYEFIIFRGSDIKDLHVSEMPKSQQQQEESPPQDPAIVSAQSVPPSAPSTQTPPVSQSQLPGGPHPHPPPPGAHPYNPFPPPAMGGYSPFGPMSYFRPPVMMGAAGTGPHPHPYGGHPQSHPPPVPLLQHPQQQSQATTSQHPPTTSTTEAQPQSTTSSSRPSTQTGITQAEVKSLPQSTTPALSSQAPHAVSSQPSAAFPPTSAPVQPQAVVTTPILAPPSSEAKPQASSTPLVSGLTTAETTPKASLPLDSESPSVSMSSAAKPSVPVEQHLVPNQPPPPPQAAVSEGPETVTQQVQNEPRDSSHGYSNTSGTERRQQRQGHQRTNYRGNSYRGGRRDYYRGPPRGGGRGGGGGGATFRYDSEFDFESANARFNKEVLEEEFKHKMSLDDQGSSRKSSEANDGLESPVSDDVVVLEDVEEDQSGIEGAEVEYYDKTKSFFDNISCEVHTAGRGNQRPSRNEEREINTETFGVSSVRGYRGNRRWRGRGRGGYGRGRGRGGYRGNQRGRYGGYQRGGGYGGKYRGGSSQQGGYQKRRNQSEETNN